MRPFMSSFTWNQKDEASKSMVEIGRGGGLVVSIPAINCDDPSSNPAGYLKFMHAKTKINVREAGVGPSLKSLFSHV